MKSRIKTIYRRILPKSIRQSAIVQSLKTRFLPHDFIYDADYYAKDVDGAALSSMPVMVDTILREFAPDTVMDVGCGTGAMLMELAQRDCKVQGLEYSEAALKICRDRGLTVTQMDFENDALDPSLKKAFDLVVSTEVAEHLPEDIADAYVKLLASLADRVIFTAATPGQGGTDHVNEQSNAYWTGKFAKLGFEYDEATSMAWRGEWRDSGKVASWYADNLMIVSGP